MYILSVFFVPVCVSVCMCVCIRVCTQTLCERDCTVWCSDWGFCLVGGWEELLHSGSRGCPIINPLPVSPTVQMVPAAHMASNPVIGILFPKLPPTPYPSPLPPPSCNTPSPSATPGSFTTLSRNMYLLCRSVEVFQGKLFSK